MSDALFNIIDALMGVAVLTALLVFGVIVLRKIRALPGAARTEIAVLNLQLIAFILWCMGIGVLTIYSGVSPLGQGVFLAAPVRLSIVAATWLLLGLIAATSIFPGVSIVFFWLRTTPLTGTPSRLAGVALFVIIIWSTIRVLA